MTEWESRTEIKERLDVGKVLVFGASGLVGGRFLELLSGDFVTPGSSELDLRNTRQVKDFLKKENPRWVINFAADTDVFEAEKQRGDKSGSCWQTNVEGTRNLVAALPLHTRLIHISTDMVFSGSAADPGSYSADHQPETDSQKLTWYGYTKAEAERRVKDRGTIVRLIYPVRANFAAKLDYLRKPLALFSQGRLYPLFDNQKISITSIDEACLGLREIITRNLLGIFHMSCPDTTTPYEIITYMLQQLGKDTSGVQRTSIDTVKNPVRYPKFGGLSVGDIEKTLGIRFSSWREIVDKLIEQGI